MNPVKYILFASMPSPIKKFILRAKGAKIGRNVHIGFFSVIYGKSIEIADNVILGHHTDIRCDILKIGENVLIGSNVKIDAHKVSIDDDSAINDEVWVGGWKSKKSVFIMGKRCILMLRSFINVARPVIFEDDVGVGGHCLLFTHAVWQSIFDGYPVKYGPISLKKGVWIPWGVFIMPGVEIGEGSTIGAYSLVTKSIPKHSLAVGVPAKVVRSHPNYPKSLEKQEKLEILKEILTDFNEHLGFIGINSKLDFNGCISLVCDNVRILFADGECNKKTSDKDIILAFNDGKIEHASFWINLDNKTANLDRTHKIHNEIIQFLRRYGLHLILK